MPGAALAEDPDIISSPTIVSAVVDMKTGVPTVTVSVTCLMPAANVRGEGLLTQRYGSGRFAFSFQAGFGGRACQAGDVLTFPVRFGHQEGRFVPGPAEIGGFMEAQLVCCFFSDDTEPLVRQPSCCIPPDAGGQAVTDSLRVPYRCSPVPTWGGDPGTSRLLRGDS